MVPFPDTLKRLTHAGLSTLIGGAVALLLFMPPSFTAAPKATPALRPTTVHAYESYVAKVQARNDRNLSQGNFFLLDDSASAGRPDNLGKLRAGEVLVLPLNSQNEKDVPGGMIHDWQGMIFIRGAKIDDVLRILQDYDHHFMYYAPDVEKSKTELHNGDHYRAFLRFRRRNVITVVLNTEHDVTYYRDSPTRAHSRSSAVHIAEVDNPGANEKEKKPGEDNGFLWRMETWWHLEEKDGGVYLQNEVVTLTRDVPPGLGWAVEPFITSIPKESLQFSLGATRRAVLSNLQNTKPN